MQKINCGIASVLNTIITLPVAVLNRLKKLWKYTYRKHNERVVRATAEKSGEVLYIGGKTTVTAKTILGNNVNFNGMTITGNGRVEKGALLFPTFLSVGLPEACLRMCLDSEIKIITISLKMKKNICDIGLPVQI